MGMLENVKKIFRKIKGKWFETKNRRFVEVEKRHGK